MENNPISSSFELISHPDRTLNTHLNQCYQVTQKIISNKYYSKSFLAKEELEQILKTLIFFHDFGKSSDFFQFKIIQATQNENPEFAKNNNLYIEWFKKNKARIIEKELSLNERLSNHALIGSYFQFSSYISNDPIINFILIEVIKRHHSYLRNFDKCEFWLNKEINNNLSNLKEISNYLNYESFNNIVKNHGLIINKNLWTDIISNFSRGRIINKNLETLKQNKELKYFFLQHYLFSLILSSDKGDMMLDDFDLIKPNTIFQTDMIDIYKRDIIKIEKSIDKKRENAYKRIHDNLMSNINNNFFSITLPTGLGKTLCAYNTAIKLQNSIKESKFRIVYCLPFTSIIDQNETVLNDIFIHNKIDTSLICKHHHLNDYKEEYKEDELKYSEAEYLTEGWEQEFIVTTFVQLLESIFTNKNRSIRKFHNLVNSIIILDEVQNISPKYYNLIETAFNKMADYFGTRFIFVTATQPILFQNSEIIIELTDPSKKETKKYFESMNRIELDISLFKKGIINDEELIKIMNDDIVKNTNKSFLIISNTIKQSQKIYKSLKIDCEKYYLSASILPIFRKEIIKKIKNSRNRKIVVSTQVVEAGVDIDLDIVYRDFAPLDSLNQSAGRCNRNGLINKGMVKIFNSGKSQYIYDSTLLDITKNILFSNEDIINENILYNLNLEYYKKVKNKVQDFSDKSKDLLSYMYELQLEKLESEFILIDDLPIYYNVFIPFDDEAKNIWIKYINCFKELNNFKRKQLIKSIKPKLLQYVTKFPKDKYSPDEDKKENKIIYENNWNDYYSLITGFKFDKSDKEIIIL
ncbi:MAG TPA: CRISPR-associated helicase Cas3' [Ignavibacteria bacterium]